MENASKALLMAAGVLIGLLIISLAVFLFFDFASTSGRLHEQIRNDQINQFNAQFTSYEGKEGITFYDIITVTNLAKDSNNAKQLDSDNPHNDYITIEFKNNVDNQLHMETLSDARLNELLKKDVDANNGILPTYDCKAQIGQNTEKVKKVIFTKK